MLALALFQGGTARAGAVDGNCHFAVRFAMREPRWGAIDAYRCLNFDTPWKRASKASMEKSPSRKPRKATAGAGSALMPSTGKNIAFLGGIYGAGHLCGDAR